MQEIVLFQIKFLFIKKKMILEHIDAHSDCLTGCPKPDF